MINVLIGAVIGVAVAFFLLMPAKEKSLKDNQNREILKLNSQIDTINNEKNDLSSQISALQGEKDSLSGQLDAKGNENNQIVEDYDKLITATNFFNAKDYVKCAENLASISNPARS